MEEKKVAIYARVSTKDQQERHTIENQLTDLRRYCKDRQFEIYKEFIDEGISGTKESRPQLDEMMKEARRRKFNIVLVWSFDRFARSTKQLIDALEDFRRLGIDFIAYQTNIDTSTPVGKMFFTVIAAIAEFEREMIRNRVIAGIERAKQNGKHLGRKPTKLVTPEAKTQKTIEIAKLRSEGKTIRQIANEVNLSPSYVFELVRQSRSESKDGLQEESTEKSEESACSPNTSFLNTPFLNTACKTILLLWGLFVNHDFSGRIRTILRIGRMLAPNGISRRYLRDYNQFLREETTAGEPMKRWSVIAILLLLNLNCIGAVYSRTSVRRVDERVQYQLAEQEHRQKIMPLGDIFDDLFESEEEKKMRQVQNKAREADLKLNLLFKLVIIFVILSIGCGIFTRLISRSTDTEKK